MNFSIIVKPCVRVYRRLTWDDVDRGNCTREHVGEVFRDKNGNAVLADIAAVYCNLDGSGYPELGRELTKMYVGESSPSAHNLLVFNNKEEYLKRKQKERLYKSYCYIY